MTRQKKGTKTQAKQRKASPADIKDQDLDDVQGGAIQAAREATVGRGYVGP